MPIKTLENQTHLEGTVIFLNAAIKTYLNHSANIKRTDPPFLQLKSMMANNLYLTDLRGANAEKGEKFNQIDLIGFKEKGVLIFFTLNTNANLTVVDFKEKSSLEQMSAETQAMARQLQEKMALETEDSI